MPYPLTVLKTLISLIKNNDFLPTLSTTLKNCLISFTISFILALTFAIISYLSTSIEMIIKPIINILKAIPTISILLIVLIWLPASQSPILVGSIILFPMMYAAFLSSLKNVDINLIEMSLIYKVSLKDKILKLYIPSITSPLLTQSKSCISLSVKLTIAAEVLAHTMNSIGIQMQIAKTYIEMDVIFAWTIIAIILSYLLELLIVLIYKIIARRKIYGH
ncbi:MAG: ABC transporter permease subunit [Erysipelotrichaceae bacterium]|nr:ABC transporter permease subunit [Erysipelotrichaceae bacterium]